MSEDERAIMSRAARDPSWRRAQAGLTLVEMMVAITVGLILLAGVIQIFASNKQTYRVQDATSRLQENGRFAVDMLRRDIRMAGFWGCNSNISTISSNLNSPANYVDITLGGISGTDGAAGAPDTITLQGAYSSGLNVNSHSQAAASFATPAGNDLKQFEIIVVSDCTKADISQISNATPGSGSVVVNTGVGVPGNATKPPQYPPGSTIYHVRKLTYSIQNDASGQPGLFLNEDGVDQEVVEGVEDMQIVYGEDTDGDGTANRYVPAGTAGLNMENVVSVRVALTLRTLEDNVALTSASGDRRIRNTFDTTVVLRNRAR
jgi:type IV pilus assembly protein PilW